MDWRIALIPCLLISALPAGTLAEADGGGARGAEADDVLAAAERFVEQSDRYLHHSRLRRGMKGYGLTTLTGTKPVRFGAEIVSVIPNWKPHRSVILARLSGQGLEKTGIISGMSGSPILVKDPRDGKEKIVGAVSFHWSGEKEPLCGVQPITQMLAIRGVLPKRKPAASQPAASKPASRQAGAAAQAPAAYLQAVLNPEKIDFAGFAWPPARGPRAGEAEHRTASPRLRSLASPLMVAAGSERLVAQLSRHLRPVGIEPVQGGGVGAAEMAEVQAARLMPGSPISVPLALGDADLTAVGTVTDVLGDRVIAFGHAFYSRGELELPMGTAYVHTVVSNLFGSFMVASTGRRIGALDRDETVGISGTIGAKIPMIPMSVTLDWTGDRRKQRYRYEICRHRFFTPMLVSELIRSSAWSWRDLPEYHTVRYEVEVDFGKLGRFRSTNVSSDSDVMWPASDATRPIAALLNTPLGKPPEVRSVKVNITIEPVTSLAVIQELKLDGAVYRPGETVTGAVFARRFRTPRERLPVRFKLPDDLPEGRYTLTASDAKSALSDQMKQMPQRFKPQKVQELFAAVQRVVQRQGSSLYLRLPLGRGGLALGRRELPDLPDSRARIIAEASRFDTHRFTSTLERAVEMKYVMSGSAQAAFTVRDRPKETLIRK